MTKSLYLAAAAIGLLSNVAVAEPLPPYQIIPYLQKSDGTSHQSFALKIDRERSTLFRCFVTTDAFLGFQHGDCIPEGPLSVNLGNSQVSVLPNPGSLDIAVSFWTIDQSTGEVRFCWQQKSSYVCQMVD